MRLGLTLPSDRVEEWVAIARQADELGIWAVEVRGAAGTEAVRAASLIQATRHVRIFVTVDLRAEHPVTLAEEIAVLDNLSGGRIGVVVEGAALGPLSVFVDALVGRVVNGMIVAPPPLQAEITVWADLAQDPADISRGGAGSPGRAALTGDLAAGRTIIDAWQAAGCTHLLVGWPGDARVLARHLVGRAAMIAFPELVAELADGIAPFDGPAEVARRTP